MPYPNISKPANINKKLKLIHRNKLYKSDCPNFTIEPAKNNTTIILGPPGVHGKAGSRILVNAGSPKEDSGQNSDLYLDKLSNNYYQKIKDNWQLQGNLTGTAGNPGSNILFDKGSPSKLLGKNGDVYINKQNGFCYHKVKDIWIFQLNIKGPQGPKGERGSKIFTAAEFPSDTIAKNGDIFINTTDNSYYTMVDKWVYQGNLTGTSTNCKLTYTILSTVVDAILVKPAFFSVAYFPWCYSHYEKYTNGLFVFSSIIYDNNLDVRIIDDNDKVIAGPFIVESTGINAIPFKLPTYETMLTLQVAKTQNEGKNPSIYAANLEISKP